MALIAFLAPDDGMFIAAQELFKSTHHDIYVTKAAFSESVAIAAALVAGGTEIIIARGSAASAIRNAGLNVIIVEIYITGFDVINAIAKAKLYGRSFGIVSFPYLIHKIDSLGPILGVDIKLYPINHESEAKAKVFEAFQDGVDAIFGGYIAAKNVQEYNIPFVLVESGVDSILQAAQEATRIAHARNLEKAKTNLFRAVLDYSYEGIISVDNEGRITFFNSMVERITGIEGSKAVGKIISQVCPNINLKEVLTTGKDELGHILSVNHLDVMCNKIAIVVNNHPVGAVVTLQDVTLIQQMEAKVRQRIYRATSDHGAHFCFKNLEANGIDLAQTIENAKDYALTAFSILIIGETGTGKEVFAQSIHNYSYCSQGPFIAINCAALPTHILESELFGYVGGAFTGANPKGKPGLFELAHGGTIFLDEIAELDYLIQGKLLRVLQEKTVRRLGSDKIIPLNVRVIVATNKDLKTLVDDNKFRADLYYRLNVLQLKIPPLRKRKNDIIALASFFLQEFSGVIKRHLKLAPSALQPLIEYPWPGNIRELQNVIARIMTIHKHEFIDSSTVKRMLQNDEKRGQHIDVLPNELAEIQKALSITKGQYTAAAQLLGISRSTLWRKLKKWGIK